MPFGFGGSRREPISVLKLRLAAKNCRGLADGFLAEAIATGDDEFFEMALHAEQEATQYEEAANNGGYRRD